MKALADHYALADLCAAFAVSPSGYYAWARRQPGPRQQADAQLGAHLCVAHAQSRATYGSPRLLQALLQQGHKTSRRRVRRLMRQHQLKAQAPRRFRPLTTDSRHDSPIAPNRLADAPALTGPNQQWVTDITCVQTGQAGSTSQP